ncbi:hypothetical protein EJB05_48706, partial [Eragrostis curvula]
MHRQGYLLIFVDDDIVENTPSSAGIHVNEMSFGVISLLLIICLPSSLPCACVAVLSSVKKRRRQVAPPPDASFSHARPSALSDERHHPRASILTKRRRRKRSASLSSASSSSYPRRRGGRARGASPAVEFRPGPLPLCRIRALPYPSPPPPRPERAPLCCVPAVRALTRVPMSSNPSRLCPAPASPSVRCSRPHSPWAPKQRARAPLSCQIEEAVPNFVCDSARSFDKEKDVNSVHVPSLDMISAWTRDSISTASQVYDKNNNYSIVRAQNCIPRTFGTTVPDNPLLVSLDHLID